MVLVWVNQIVLHSSCGMHTRSSLQFGNVVRLSLAYLIADSRMPCKHLIGRFKEELQSV